jgi:uncharacterized short protein YbdD (DUF466 family)
MNSVVANVLVVVRRVVGAPDYDLYLRHMSEHHPECAALTERQFRDERLAARYSQPGSRCC